MAIKIVIDSTADLQSSVIEKNNLHRVSLKVHFGEQTFRDWIDLNPADFYKKLATTKKLPTTSQPSPADFIELYEKITPNKEDSIISIHLASKLSGTYQSAYLAKSMLEDKDITVIDSRQATSGTGFVALAAAQAVENGKSKNEVIELINNIINNQKTFFMVNTLDYLEKGGRVGKASALIGSILNIKPILSLDEEGGVIPLDKARGKKKASHTMIQLVKNQFADKKLSIAVCHADVYNEAEQFMELIKNELNVGSSIITDIGPVIGTHVGPGTIGVVVREQSITD